jgi:hypothetical protein
MRYYSAGIAGIFGEKKFDIAMMRTFVMTNNRGRIILLLSPLIFQADLIALQDHFSDVDPVPLIPFAMGQVRYECM